MKLKGVKDRLKDENLDLSLCDLQEVPVREIAAVRKATSLDLSSNCLTVLPTTFVTLRHILKLDLSRNTLTEIPENFGEMTQLRHLDLYANRISRLPLSLGELKNLRWLDLKENPLTPAVASVAGACSNLVECQKCARNIVAFLSNAKLAIEEEKLKRLHATTETDVDNALPRKEGKKKKKKVEKEGKKDLDKNKNKQPGKTKDNQNLNNGSYEKMVNSASNDGNKRRRQVADDKLKAGFCQTFMSVIAWCFFICIVFMVAILVMPLYFDKESVILMEYIETNTGISLKAFHKYSTDKLRFSTEVVTDWSKNFYHTMREVYEKNLGGKES